MEHKRRRKEECSLSLLELGGAFFSAIRYRNSGFLDSQTLLLKPAAPSLSGLWPWTGTSMTDSPGSQAFRLRLNYTTVFPSSPACRWQTVGLSSPRANAYNKSLIPCSPFLLLVPVLWRTLNNTSNIIRIVCLSNLTCRQAWESIEDTNSYDILVHS